MPNPVTSPSSSTASSPPPPAPSTTGTTSTTSPTPPPPQDIVEITAVQTEQTTRPSKPRTYGPRSVADKFRYNIDHGMFNDRLRYNPLSVRFQNVASNTYEARQSVSGQVTQFSGQSSSSSALFALNYQDAQPNPNQATTHVDARVEQNRRIDRGLDLLNLL